MGYYNIAQSTKAIKITIQPPKIMSINQLVCAINLNIHFLMFFLKGAITNNQFRNKKFIRTKRPSHSELERLGVKKHSESIMSLVLDEYKKY